MAPQGVDFRRGDSDAAFDDVIGHSLAKRELRAIAERLAIEPRAASRFRPVGLILAGPSGVGKSALAAALAANVRVPAYVNAGDITPRELRRQYDALAATPSLLVWDDGGPLIRDRELGGSLALAFCEALDGAARDHGPVTLVVTSSPESRWDSAFARPGRCSPTIRLSLPNRPERDVMWRSCLDPYMRVEDDEITDLSLWSGGFTGADIGNAVESAVSLSKLDGLDEIDLEILREVVRRRGFVCSAQPPTAVERNELAVHAAGHAVAADSIWGTGAVVALSIGLPGTHPTVHLADEFGPLDVAPGQALEAVVEIELAGSAAEELIFGAGHISGAASRDIQRARDLMRSSVWIRAEDVSGVALRDAVERIHVLIRDRLTNRRETIVRLASELLIDEHGELSGPHLAALIAG